MTSHIELLDLQQKAATDALEKGRADPTMIVAYGLLFGMISEATPGGLLHENLRACVRVLEHGAEKHGDKRHRGAKEDLDHAIGHIFRSKTSSLDDDTKEPHLIHAAVDSLLAFFSLVGSFRDAKGPVAGVRK